MSRVEVSIMGQSLVLSSPDGEEDALREAAHRVDAAMCRIRDAGKVKARERIAILASLNLVFEMMNTGTTAAAANHPCTCCFGACGNGWSWRGQRCWIAMAA